MLLLCLTLSPLPHLTGCQSQSQSPKWLTGYNNKANEPTKTPKTTGVDLQLINTTGEIVELQVSGLSWEKDTIGPNLTAVLGANQKTSYDYGKTITVNYPILVHWRGLATGKTQSWAITGVGGTEEKETTLKGNGLLIIGLSPQYQLNSFFLRDVNATEKEAFQIARTGHR